MKMSSLTRMIFMETLQIKTTLTRDMTQIFQTEINIMKGNNMQSTMHNQNIPAKCYESIINYIIEY